MPIRRVLAITTLAIGALACAGSTIAAQPPAGPITQPLAAFAAQKVAVMPVQFLRADTAGPVRAADWAGIRKALDDSIGAAIAERGIGKKWAYAADIERMAKRNAVYVSDPASLGAGSLRTRPLKPEEQVSPVLVNNLRSLIALGDSRFALIPVELWFAHKGAESRASLRLVLVDGRVGQIAWAGDLAGEAGTAFGAATIGALAQRVADLIAGR